MRRQNQTYNPDCDPVQDASQAELDTLDRPSAPPDILDPRSEALRVRKGDALEDARAWGMLAYFEMSGNHWRDRDTVRFAIEYAQAEIQRQTPAIIERFISDVRRDVNNTLNLVQTVSASDVFEAMQTVKARREGGEGK